MPPALQSPTRATSQGSILLLEEYDALAAAIGSALKKFAPQHATQLARSLTEAEKLAAKIEPALFIIDFDPAYPGLTAFLEKMRTTHPDARVLVIAPRIPREIMAEWRSFGALQFIGKPFDVANLGAAVQALLGPWKEPDSAHSRGTLRSLSLADIVLLQCAGGRSVTIEARRNNRQSGEIYVLEGELAHAQTGRRTGADALEEMFAWPEAEIHELEKPTAARRTIGRDWASVFLEAFREAKAQQPAPPEKPAPAKPPPKTGKKIVVIDDTEMLLIFVEDVLATVDPQLQITTALNGTSGIKEIERIIPDLVLLDYSLPDVNGDEVCRRLLQDKRTARIPVLMMSGHVPEMSQAAAALDNIVATIAKPFLSEALIGLVQQTLSEEPRPAPKTAPAAKAVEPAPLPATARDKKRPRRARTPKPVKRLPARPSAAIKKPRRRMKVKQVASKPSIAPAPLIPPKQPETTKQIASKPSVTPPSIAPKQPKTTKRVDAKPRVTPAPAITPAQPEISKQIDSKPSAAPIPSITPVQPEISKPIDSKPRVTPAPAITPALPEPAKVATTISAPVVPKDSNEVALDLFLEVVSMQLTAELRMSAIRARPSKFPASLHVQRPTLLDATAVGSGFELGRVELDGHGKIQTLRLVPTLRPIQAPTLFLDEREEILKHKWIESEKAGYDIGFERALLDWIVKYRPSWRDQHAKEARCAFEVEQIGVVPANSRGHIQITPVATAPMIMQMLANFELAAVELSASLVLAQLILKSHGNRVLVTCSLSPAPEEKTSAPFESVEVQLDASGHIVEIFFQSVA